MLRNIRQVAVVHEAIRRAGADGAVRLDPDRGTSPDQSGRPHPMLRGLLEGDYRGFTGQFEAHQLVLPASASVPVLLKMVDSPFRPPAFLLGAHGRVSVQPGSCAESYLQLRMAPLGAYRLLGLPISELGGAIVDLEDILGKPARRLLDAMREAPAWAQRFDLVDRFLRAAAAPTELTYKDIHASALTRNHLHDDVRGINASLDLIRRTRGGPWPTEPVSNDFNYVDLVWHECEFREGDSFTYAAYDAGGQYLGCCYLYPMGRRTPLTEDLLGFDVDVSWWVTPDAYERGYYTKLYSALRHWIATAFPFPAAYYSNAEIPSPGDD